MSTRRPPSPTIRATIRWLAVLSAFACLLPVSAGEMTRGLRAALDAAEPDDRIPVVLLMEEFKGHRQLGEETRGMTAAERRRHVVASRKAQAERSQRILLDRLGAVDGLRVLWGVNGLAIRATPELVERIAEMPEVRWVLHDGGRGEPAAPFPATASAGVPSLTGPTGGDVSGPNPTASVAGEVVAMGAPDVWQAGYTGAGVIVAVLDTGVYPDHPDLADHIWANLDEIPGNGIDDDANGYVDDTWGWDMCDQDNQPVSGAHGTQVAGQVAGDGTNGVVTGMAPDAELMVIGFDCSPPDSIGWEASDYAIENGAHVITESFIWPWEDPPDYEGWRRQMDTELAAGVIHINAAGNDGDNMGLRPIPYNVAAPANCPAPWLHPDQTLVGGVSSVVAVANIDWSTDTLASHSSRGPSAWEDIVAYSNPDYPFPLTEEYMDYPYENGVRTGLIKPDLAAYGNGTTTTCPGTGYCGFSGTSSATPHVSGIVALMLQANPEASPAELAEALMTTAAPRGAPGKNNDYGTGLVQALPAVLAVESTVAYRSHLFDDGAYGNGDGRLDPGETITLVVEVESRTDATIQNLQAILTSTTPGIEIHNRLAKFPPLTARGSATSDAPHFSFTVDPTACADVVAFDLEFRYGTSVRHATFSVRVGDETPAVFLDDDFESPSGWTSDPGTAQRGDWTREDPVGVSVIGGLSNPEDDTTPDPGVTCWVTGSGGGNPNNNDVDGGSVYLWSPPFGAPHLLELDLSYDHWYYDDSSGGDSFKAEVSADGGASWTLIEQRVTPTDGWRNVSIDLMAALTPGEDMVLRYTVTDGSTDTVVEGAVDEVHLSGVWVDCDAYNPPAAQAPNPVGNTLRLERDPAGTTMLSWTAPPTDGEHDPATLYGIGRANAPDGIFPDVGTATATEWYEIDPTDAGSLFYYLVGAKNNGGTEP